MPKLTPPPGWTLEQCHEAADLAIRMAESSLTDPTRTEKFARYSLAQDVFDDKKVLTHLEIVRDIEPYGIPLIRKLVKGMIRLVVSAFNGADPYYIFKSDGSQDSDLREAREQDTQLMLEADGYKEKIRDTARTAAIWARGPYRADWVTRKKGEGWLNVAQPKEGELEFAGVVRESIPADKFILYPLSAKRIPDVRAIGMVTYRPMYEIWEMQDRGEYFSREDVPIQAVHEQPNQVDSDEDRCPDLVSMIVKLPTGMDKSKPLVAWELTAIRGQRKCLYMKAYDKPMPNYFGPGFEFDPDSFYPTHSPASAAFEPATMLNDVQTTRMLAGVAASKRIIFVTGHVGEMMTKPILIGDVVLLRGDPKVIPIDVSAPAQGDLQALAEEARRDGEGITGFAESMAGQLPDAQQTATASGIAASGAAEEGQEKQQNFMAEEIRYVRFVQIMARRNFKDLKKVYGKKLRTKSARDWDEDFEIVPNGQGPSNNPQLTAQKLSEMVKLLRELEIPWLEEVEEGMVPNVGVAISKIEFAKAINQNMDLPMSTEKIIVDTSALATPPPEPEPVGSGIPFGGDPAALGAGIPPELLGDVGGGLPPELLAQLLMGAPQEEPGFVGGPELLIPGFA